MKKATFTLILTLISLFTLKVFAQTMQDLPDKILGVYWSPKKDAKIEIYINGNHYFGKTIWTAVSRKDTQNPDQRLRKRDLLGINLLTDFSYDDGVYVDGQIYDPENGKTYSCKISFSGRNLKVRGYIGISLLGRTETFERVL
ncbi:DUF2147 domain-containing protein [Flavisolibacter tropicus]|uniref:SIGNAL peptide protein n=1 Tax=Flavisolibacter tropicus TaxID=1492898 RepID=A0A172U148_9BACT|nr:DUF2147 domain-containing protein [Flavisolibacter tropicus]ANE53075.1 SIGNAL peptide protein [Flavisolibacter tropicus]